MSKEALIIGDIAGQYDALMRLTEKFPNTDIILVGDLVDRGPKSKEVIEWAMNNDRVTAVLGNHEHMMIDFCRNAVNRKTVYSPSIWIMNGGGYTLQSYDQKDGMSLAESIALIPNKHLEWLESLPIFIQQDGYFISHAPWSKLLDLSVAMDLTDFSDSLIWNRYEPKKRDSFQIFGHNAHWGVRWFKDWGVCIDGSRSEVLTGLHWPSKVIYQEPYNQDE